MIVKAAPIKQIELDCSTHASGPGTRLKNELAAITIELVIIGRFVGDTAFVSEWWFRAFASWQDS